MFALLIGTLLTGLGFIREFVFENINAQIYTLWYDYEHYTLPASLSFLNSWTADELYNLKFPLTVACCLLYFLIAHFTVRRFFPLRKHLWFNAAAHGIVFGLAGLFFTYGLIFDDYDNGYKFSRIFMDFLQSPMMLMIIIPGLRLYKSNP